MLHFTNVGIRNGCNDLVLEGFVYLNVLETECSLLFSMEAVIFSYACSSSIGWMDWPGWRIGRGHKCDLVVGEE